MPSEAVFGVVVEEIAAFTEYGIVVHQPQTLRELDQQSTIA